MSKFFEYRNFRLIGIPGNYKLISTLTLQSQVKIKLNVKREFVSLDVRPSEITTFIIKSNDDTFSQQYALRPSVARNYKTVYDLIDALYESSHYKKQFKKLVSIPSNLIAGNPHLMNLLEGRFAKLANKPISADFTEFTNYMTGGTLEMSDDGILSSEMRKNIGEVERKAQSRFAELANKSMVRFLGMINPEIKQGYTLNNESTIDESFKQLFEKRQNYKLYRSINGHVGLLISLGVDSAVKFNLPNFGGGVKGLPNKCQPFNHSFADYNISELSIIYPGNHEVRKFYDFKKDDLIIDYIIDQYKFIRSKFAMAFEKASAHAKAEMPYINLVLPFIAANLGLTIYSGEQPRYAWSTVGDKIIDSKFDELQPSKFNIKSRATSNFMMAQTLKYLGILNETQLNQISVHIAGTLFEMLVYMAERENKFELRDKLLNTLFELSRKVTKNS